MRVAILAGGVGGAKLAHGLQQILAPGELSVIVNTADDLELHGLLVMPDHDTVMYTLGGIADRSQGWGVTGDTFEASEVLGRYGAPTWFRIGDRDLGTHVRRTQRLREGAALTEACRELQVALGIPGPILPMTDEPVRTRLRTDDGWLSFQEYFVHRQQRPEVFEVRFEGLADARPTPAVEAALRQAEAILFAPSNPLVSVAPILELPGFSGTLEEARAGGRAVVAISPIVGGRALRGPADRMLRSLGHESSALGVARLYAGRLDGFILDRQDAKQAPLVERLGMRVLVTDTVMSDDAARARLASEATQFAQQLTS